jgi:SAM-dependent methyltransferase
MKSANNEDGVRRYYDRNTKRFLRFGHGGREGAIHRAVWGPGVRDRRGAIEYVNQLVLRELQRIGARSVLDLGCGVGGSLGYLAKRHAAQYTGVTLSPVQADAARRLIRVLPNRVGERITVRVGDFHDASDLAGSYDAVYAIEALLHATNPEQVLANLRDAVTDGGVLIVCDDFLGKADITPSQRKLVRRFRRGWHASGLAEHSTILELCRNHGFNPTADIDLSPYLELGRPRDKAIRATMALFSWLPLSTPWWRNMLGGDALQECLRCGVISYRFIVCRRG